MVIAAFIVQKTMAKKAEVAVKEADPEVVGVKVEIIDKPKKGSIADKTRRLAEMKAELRDAGVKFHPRTGYDKIKKLYDGYKKQQNRKS